MSEWLMKALQTISFYVSDTEKLFLILLQTANLLQAIISYSVLVFCPSVSVKWLTLSKKWI